MKAETKLHRRKAVFPLEIGSAISFVILLAGAVVFALPFLWMVSISLKEPAEVSAQGLRLIPSKIMWGNYPKALTIMPFHLYLLNTLKVTILTVVGTAISSSIVAFAFARLRAPGKDLLFIIVLSTIMLPAEVTMIPRFVIFRSIGWYDTLLPLIIPAFFGNAFYIFLMRQFFLTIPADLEDAAKIDGCTAFRTFWQVFLPLSKPVLVTVAVFSFVAHWNDFMTPLIYLNSVDKRTLALGLATFQDVWGVDIISLMAASTAVLIPVLVIFFLAQRYFVQGVVMSGIKG
ncbi:MAG: carbohydrate ABC transporter permease [Armatimonadetes bacterium]|nr:carbohydrate ABC transporter permease [Armatimonadota bacterium]